MWQSVYGEKADSVQALLDAVYPDLGICSFPLNLTLTSPKTKFQFVGWFTRTIGYGLTYGHTEILSSLETSYALVAALIAGDTPQQITWHLEGAQRSGATLEEVQAVREISIEAAKLSGVCWQHSVPEVHVGET